MQAQQTVPDVEAAWRFLLVNWIFVGAMGVVLALSLAFTNFSLELTGLAISVGYVGLYAGFAHANAVSPKRRDPQVMFVLGGTAQIVLITAVMTPLTYVAASTTCRCRMQPARHRPRARFRLGRLCALCRRSSGARGVAELRLHHDPLADFRHSGRAGGDAPLSAHRGIHLRLRPRLDRDHDHFRTGAGDRRVSADRTRSDQHQEPQSAALSRPAARSAADPRRRLASSRSVRSRRHRDVPELPRRFRRALCLGAVAGALDAAASWSLAFTAMLAATPINGGHYLIDIIAGTAIAVVGDRRGAPRRTASSPGGKFAVPTARWSRRGSGANKAHRIAVGARRASTQARCAIKPITISDRGKADVCVFT